MEMNKENILKYLAIGGVAVATMNGFGLTHLPGLQTIGEVALGVMAYQKFLGNTQSGELKNKSAFLALGGLGAAVVASVVLPFGLENVAHFGTTAAIGAGVAGLIKHSMPNLWEKIGDIREKVFSSSDNKNKNKF